MKPPGERIFLPCLLALSALLYFTDLSGRDLWEPNEPTPAQAVREMKARGDWLLPTVNGEVYSDKPPLLFWAIALASFPGGRVTETTARLPSAAAGTLLVLALYLLARPALGGRGAFLAALTLAVSNFYVEQSRYVQHDMLLTLGTALGILFLFRIADDEKPRLRWILAAASALALGVLAKGPVALALAGLVVAVDTLFDRSLLRRWVPMGAAGCLALLPSLAYSAALDHRHGTAALSSFIFHHNIEKFVSGFDNLEPWWFYLVRFPADMLPVSLFLPAAVFFRPEDPLQRRLHRRLWIWILVTLAFFSLSASKRPVYLLPLLPAASILCGALLDARASGRLRPLAGRLTGLAQGAGFLILGAAGAAAPILARRRAPDLAPEAWLLAAVAMAGAAAGLVLLSRGRTLAAHGSLAAALAAVWMVTILWVNPAANRFNSPRTFALEINRLVPPGAPLRTYGLYRVRAGYPFYAERMMTRLEDRAALERFLKKDERVYCVLTKELCEDLLRSPGLPHYLLAEGGAGSRRDCLISNRPEPGPAPPAPGSPGKDPGSPGPGARSGNGS